MYNILLQILNGPSCEQHNSSKVFNINQHLLSELNMFYKVHLFKVLLQCRHYHAVIAFPFHRHQPFHIKVYKHWGGGGGGLTISSLSIIWRLFHGSKMFNSSCWAMRSVRSFITACRHSQNSSSSGADELSKLHARMSGSCVRVCFSLKVHN